MVWGLPKVWVREGPCMGQEPEGSESARVRPSSVWDKSQEGLRVPGCGQALCGRQEFWASILSVLIDSLLFQIDFSLEY